MKIYYKFTAKSALKEF